MSEMSKRYQRRADWGDAPLPNKLGVLKYELELALEIGTPEEIANARAAIARMEEVIAKLTPKPCTGDYTKAYESWDR